MRNRILRGGWLVAVVLAFALPPAAQAIPVTYYHTGGTVTITLTAGINTLAVLPNVPLAGGRMTFDSAAEPGNALTDFQLDVGAVNFTLSQSYAGRDTVMLHSSAVRPASGYASNVILNLSAGGIDNYTMVSAGQLDVTSNFSALNSAGPPPPPITGNIFNFNFPAASGKIFITGGSLNMTQVGVVLGTIGPLGSETSPLVVSGNFFFQGVVPEPHTAALVGFGLVGLMAVSRRVKSVKVRSVKE